MDSDSWARLASSSRRYHSRSDVHNIGEEYDSNEEARPEYLCPFCAEDFDIVGLCCHIDEEHPIEAKNGICPVCAKRVGMDLVGHITGQHANLLKVQRKRRYRRGGSNLTFAILRKELREGNLQSLLGGSSCLVSSSTAEPDPLLSSFVFNPSGVDEDPSIQPLSATEECPVETSVKKSSRGNLQESPLSDKDQEEKARKCEFVQGLLLSTFLGDDL